MSDHKPRMAPHPDAPAGLEQDSKGNPIPFEERTAKDQEKVGAAVAAAMRGDPSQGGKDPEGEAQDPAPTPDIVRASHRALESSAIPKGNRGKLIVKP